jgi:redox-sensitive bicupin YhaK (pirin superfamily)
LHPHRGFETISFMRKGFMDHSDSLGAAARFGRGDVQWMTAGSGIVHAEMFPLLNRDDHNETELFQIWINLPATDKMVPPHFSMLWSHEIPHHTFLDEAGRPTEVTVVAGELVTGQRAPAPPPHSWVALARRRPAPRRGSAPVRPPCRRARRGTGGRRNRLTSPGTPHPRS